MARILYFTRLAQLSEGPGFIVAKQFVSRLQEAGHEVLVRALVVQDRIQHAASNELFARFEADFTDLSEMDSFRPDVVICEQGLNLEREPEYWKAPSLWLDDFVSKGGLLIVDGINRSNLNGYTPAQLLELFDFLGIRPLGSHGMEEATALPYLRDLDEESGAFKGYLRRSEVIDDGSLIVDDLPIELWEGIDYVLVENAMPLDDRGFRSSSSHRALGITRIGVPLSQDLFIQPDPIGNQWATVELRGDGYVVCFAGYFIWDELFARVPNNERFILQIIEKLLRHCQINSRMRRNNPVLGRPIVDGASNFLGRSDQFHIDQIDSGEGRTIEFKSSAVKSKESKKEVVRQIAAFANTDGGFIYVGVHDETGQIQGIDPEMRSLSSEQFAQRDEFRKRLQKAANLHLGDSRTSAVFDVAFLELDGKTVAVIEVLPAKAPVYFASDIGGQTRLLRRNLAEIIDLGAAEISTYLQTRFAKS
jgi:hypothetical protein